MPPSKEVKLEQKRDELYKKVMERRIQQEIPVVFRELRSQAQAKNFLTGSETQSDLVREVQKELKETANLGGLGSPRRK